MKKTPTPPIKFVKLIYVPKNKGEPSSKENANLKSIIVHPSFSTLIEKPFATSKFLDFLPRSLTIIKNKEFPKDCKCSIKESNAKDGTI